MSARIRVGVLGARGRMGAEVVKAVTNSTDRLDPPYHVTMGQVEPQSPWQSGNFVQNHLPLEWK